MSIENDVTKPLPGNVVRAEVIDYDLAELIAQAQRDIISEADGAVVTFDGIIRNHDGGKEVSALTYTAHPLADAEMKRVVSEVAREFPDTRMWAVHRIGALGIGDCAFCVITASAHRGNAFAACMRITDIVKSSVPIWKEQFLPDGTSEWVGVD